MLQEAELRLVHDDRHQDDPIPLERRTAHRKPVNNRVTALVLIPSEDSTRNRICSLFLRDMSDTGIGAVSVDPVPLNSQITMFFPPHGSERGFDLYGKVVWTRRSSDGFELGLALDRQATACA